MALTIGRVAAAAGVNVQTIRYYERRGLLPSPSRTPAGYRQYSGDAIDRLRFIRHAQELGFPLADVQELLALQVRRNVACTPVEKAVRRQIDRVQSKILSLRRIEQTLQQLASACATRRPTTSCPILEALEEDANTSN